MRVIEKCGCEGTYAAAKFLGVVRRDNNESALALSGVVSLPLSESYELVRAKFEAELGIGPRYEVEEIQRQSAPPLSDQASEEVKQTAEKIGKFAQLAEPIKSQFPDLEEPYKAIAFPENSTAVYPWAVVGPWTEVEGGTHRPHVAMAYDEKTAKRIAELLNASDPKRQLEVSALANRFHETVDETYARKHNMISPLAEMDQRRTP
jgi:hypothetical protein